MQKQKYYWLMHTYSVLFTQHSTRVDGNRSFMLNTCGKFRLRKRKVGLLDRRDKLLFTNKIIPEVSLITKFQFSSRINRKASKEALKKN